MSTLPETEQSSLYQNLDHMTVAQALQAMNELDMSVPQAIHHALPQLEQLIAAVAERLQQGGRLFYIGAGTSGRLGVLDASECPPTFGVAKDKVIGLMAGGDRALRDSVEGAEDDTAQGWLDLQAHNITSQDIVIGIAASGRTPYTLGVLQHARTQNVATGCIVCTSNSVIAAAVDYPVTIVTGAEFVTGSTRLKAGTAQKLVLNMISTVAMIKLGRVKGNSMVNMQLSNQKLVARGVAMLQSQTNLSEDDAKELLLKHGSVQAALDNLKV